MIVRQGAVHWFRGLAAAPDVRRENRSRRSLFAICFGRANHCFSLSLTERIEWGSAGQPVIAVSKENRLHPRIVPTERMQHFFEAIESLSVLELKSWIRIASFPLRQPDQLVLASPPIYRLSADTDELGHLLGRQCSSELLDDPFPVLDAS